MCILRLTAQISATSSYTNRTFSKYQNHAAHVTGDGSPSRAISIIQMKAAIESNKARDNGSLDYADPHTQQLHPYFFA